MASPGNFDTIIVGAGSAGCILAHRLSTDPAHRVLLLEAGGWDWHPFIRIPLGVGRIWGFGRFDWGYSTEPDPTAGNRSIETARGKVIGGSHSINAMGYIRGHRGDYDRWAAQGLPGWSFRELLPYLKRAETWEDGETPFRGGAGPLFVRRSKQQDPLYDAYIQAGIKAGHPYTDDYNGPQQHGFGWAQWTIRNGKRDSTARAYLHPARGRANLTILPRSLCTRVLIENGRATGVAYTRHGQAHTAHAAQVILSGGSINTPQLLMLSGIGNPDHLRSHGITPVAALPGVGQNLQDHYSTGLFHERRGPGPFVHATRADRLALSFAQAYLLGTGPATDVPSGFMAFVKTNPSLPMPDIQLLFRSGPRNAGPWFPGIRPPWQDAFVCRPILLRPKSRGEILLRSADPTAPPRIRQNFLSHPEDLPVLRAGLRLLREVAAQSPLDPHRGREIGPGASATTDDDLAAYIRANPATAHHPCGTCRMGIDEMAVADAQLRVRGIQGLRIADASVMPDLVGGNINAAVITIAEKAADLIRGTAPPIPADV